MEPTLKTLHSHLITNVTASYNQMEGAIGFEPNVQSGDGKSYCSWEAEETFDDEPLYLAVWDWKEPTNPKDNPDEPICWSVWYSDPKMLDLLQDRLG